ncbi:MAG: hypothetical protein ACTSR7_07135 [Promethearchaeota archaeon]
MSEEKLTFKKKFLFGLSAFPDQLTYQIFQFLIFTFYFTVVKIPLLFMIITYVFWGIWNVGVYGMQLTIQCSEHSRKGQNIEESGEKEGFIY